MHYLRSESHPDIDIFRDASFSVFREVLDVEMKRLQKEGLGSKPCQAEPLSVQDEEQLWTKRKVVVKIQVGASCVYSSCTLANVHKTDHPTDFI